MWPSKGEPTEDVQYRAPAGLELELELELVTFIIFTSLERR